MKFKADLHIHSPFSRATSKKSTLTGLAAWAGIKGIDIVGTGDFTHPGWLRHLKDNLVPAEPGLFRLADEKIPPALPGIDPAERPVRFLLTAEISNIYKRHQQVRKVHNIIFAPDFESVTRINHRLNGIGNLEADGRPILGLDSRDLLEIMLEEAEDGFLVPAHIWTPWFSLFGARSGFDAIEECYGDLTSHIFALETGLSSDPAMNRKISALDRFTLISNSDCHSPAKLGREVNLFDTSLDYFALRRALEKDNKGFQGTVEFFPDEGKYHLDGHRKCEVCLTPAETRKLKGVCPVCSRQLTIGVNHRIMDLADRDQPLIRPDDPMAISLIPLQEVIAELMGRGLNTKGVMKNYHALINRFASEFNILLETPIEDLKTASPILAEAINRMRQKKVIRQGGFDGQFGTIHLFSEKELPSSAKPAIELSP